ncbi:helix-turn-helix transcriptional regulator [Cellulomonas terrae]|uniref:AraC family transcriptional regulator n=1 Tax=Cellulomonas terrae TaxID=311234 RepID=A0A511JKD4_9CELL|nr:helix-turn-helix transcriptional regulator [Cellulomonas terrae]GEL98467.1 AraC family transcriptional regulator [Cellulomonas terrae]
MTDDFTYLTHEPTGPLRRFVASIWYARGRLRAPAERVAPTGSAVLGLVLGAPIAQVARNGHGDGHVARTGFLLGPDDQPMLNRPLGETWCVGVVATPIGCATAFGVDPRALRGRLVGAEPWAPVRRELLALDDPGDMIAAVEDVLRESVAGHEPALPRCTDAVEAAVAALVADPGRPVADVARELHLSHAHLDRGFRRVVGLSPGTFARVTRMRDLLASLDTGRPVGWGQVAADRGWYDQAHLIRHFRRHTGTTPAAYVAAYRAVYGDAATEPGFAPVVNPVQDSPSARA